MITVLSDRVRKAAHGKHRCGWCWRMIKARSSYIDRRCAYDGTCRTFRYHSECDGLVGRAAAYWGIDDDDDWSEESIWCFVTEYQSDTGLDGTGWPEVPTESGPAS